MNPLLSSTVPKLVVKLMLMGDVSVGKTAITHQLINDPYLFDSIDPTIEARYAVLVLDLK
jgi:GTPase SAR1 family protein